MRVNLVPPELLADQHLIAEFRINEKPNWYLFNRNVNDWETHHDQLLSDIKPYPDLENYEELMALQEPNISQDKIVEYKEFYNF